MKENSIEYLVGSEKCVIAPQVPFNNLIIEFLDDLSKKLIKDTEAKKYSDVISFAFWCRKSSINKINKKLNIIETRIGKGLVFHIAPGNIPVNFAFSFAFSLLAGNSNIVRVSTKKYEQVNIICRCLKEVMSEEKYEKIRNSNSIIRYEHDDKITECLSVKSNARMIWGGDNTIEKIQKLSKPPQCIDITFPDRYSFALIDSDRVLELNEAELTRLADNFYNDTYYNDQNACSSPKLILWKGNNINLAKEKFWNCVYDSAQKYNLEDEKAVEKYMDICRNAIDSDEDNAVTMNGNLLYRIKLKNLSDDIIDMNAKFGTFYEYDIDDVSEIEKIINYKYQTLTYFGIKKEDILNLILERGLTGIDRIVPIGKATDINIIWDGYDLVRLLSRIVSVE